MCLSVVALNAHARYPLIIAGNRDEFYARATAAAGWWDGVPDLLAGRDLVAGGTWLGITRRGRFALVTNFRDGQRQVAAESRGALVTEYLLGDLAPIDFVAASERRADRFGGCNLIVGETTAAGATAAYWSNRGGAGGAIGDGVHALSNALLDTPWPKTERTRRRIASWLQAEDPAPPALDPLWNALADRERAPDHELPSTGVPLDWERLLSAPFIATADYGTRVSTLLLVDRSGRVQFIERGFGPGGNPLPGGAEQHFDFQLA